MKIFKTLLAVTTAANFGAGCQKSKTSKNGSVVVIDYKGFIDGKAFAGGEDKNYPLKLGSNTFIPGFEDQLIGYKASDAVEVRVTFPENYHMKALAGKKSVFEVLIKKVK